MFDDPIGDHVRLVETVAAAGVQAPQEWTDLLDRMNTFGPNNPAVSAITGGGLSLFGLGAVAAPAAGKRPRCRR